MRKVHSWLVALTVLAFTASEPVGLLAATPTPEMLRDTIRKYVSSEEAAKGSFSVFDSKLGVNRKLKLERVHERVGKTGVYYYSCADLKDIQTGDLLDLDFDVSDNNGALKVVDVRIHKDNGKPRYTYDNNSNMIPVK